MKPHTCIVLHGRTNSTSARRPWLALPQQRIPRRAKRASVIPSRSSIIISENWFLQNSPIEAFMSASVNHEARRPMLALSTLFLMRIIRATRDHVSPEIRAHSRDSQGPLEVIYIPNKPCDEAKCVRFAGSCVGVCTPQPTHSHAAQSQTSLLAATSNSQQSN